MGLGGNTNTANAAAGTNQGFLTGDPTQTQSADTSTLTAAQRNAPTLNSVNSMLNQQAMGQGPVQQASQAQLQNATNQGVQNATGVVANTKGINPALAGRIAGQNAAQSTQQAANASAALTAQNAMNAQQQLSSNLSNQFNTEQSGINATTSANAGANTAAENGTVGMESGLISGGATFLSLADGGTVDGTSDPYDNGNVVPTPQAPPPSQSTSSKSSSSGGGGGSAASSLLPLLLAADGAAPVQSPTPIFINNTPASTNSSSASSGPKSKIGKSLAQTDNSGYNAGYNLGSSLSNLGKQLGQGIFGGDTSQPAATDADASPAPIPMAADEAPTPNPMAKGGKVKHKDVPALVSPGERYLPPNTVKKVVDGKANPMKVGQKIPGKASVPGNSLKNDTVPKTLKEGGIVLPRSVTESKNPPKAAMDFVRAHMNKRRMGK